MEDEFHPNSHGHEAMFKAIDIDGLISYINNYNKM
jgi:hypothetical protein